MAEQKGIVKLKGAIGDLSFYKSGDGYMAKEKSVIDKKRIKNDPAFQRTRENGAEFGRAGKASKMLRASLRQLLKVASDKRVTSRLTTEMLKIIKSDTVNLRGERRIAGGNLNQLTGFDFNVNSNLSSVLFTGFTMNIDRAAGNATIQIAEFVPGEHLLYPQGCSHVKLMAGLSEIDFEEEVFRSATVVSDNIVLGSQVQAPIDFSLEFAAGTTMDLFLTLGIEFMQEVNGAMYSLKNGTFNALSVIALSRVDGQVVE